LKIVERLNIVEGDILRCHDSWFHELLFRRGLISIFIIVNHKIIQTCLPVGKSQSDNRSYNNPEEIFNIKYSIFNSHPGILYRIG
jgi:hypothetical protein